MQKKKTDVLFVKLYIRVLKSGLLAEISGNDWKTLCALAGYMDRNGYCNPSQGRLARDLDVQRDTVSQRIKSLLKFRFRGEPILQAGKKIRKPNGKFQSLKYRILSSSGLQIFRISQDK
ncbi:helix-turn-helix domain-containing protein [bacterium]|nr:helix-turn-helix domain-containing protein [bacterium]